MTAIQSAAAKSKSLPPLRYSHLDPSLWPLMAQGPEARLRYLDEDCFIEHPLATYVLERLERLVTYPKSRRPPGIFLVGESSIGKTTVLEEFERRFPAEARPDRDHAYVPVLRIQFPERGGDKIWGEITKALNLQISPNATSDRKRDAALEFMDRLGVRVLVVDELANAVNTTVLKQGLALNTIKSIMNHLKRPVVVGATFEVHDVIRREEQMYRRFEMVYLTKFEYDHAFKVFMRGWESVLPLDEPSFLATNEKLGKRIIEITNGLTGDIERLLKTAARKAIRCGGGITLDLLDDCGFVTREDEVEALRMLRGRG